ncbi:sensor histidine kinase [Crossiella sp. CA198]|uniref:sensor histidine kinase n=1 Tax=Crossiella sp. CA198 TaxID=3455607 RepID=UPI003F8D197E
MIRSVMRWALALQPQVADSIVAAAVTGVALLLVHRDPPFGVGPLTEVTVGLVVLSVMPNAFRRLAPVPVLLLTSVGYSVYVVCGYPDVISPFGVWLALYTVAVHRQPRLSVPVILTVIPLMVVVLALARDSWVTLLQGMLHASVAWLLGASRHSLTQRNRQLAELAVEMHADRERQAQRAVTEERVRIARELHDVVAHHMSVISVQAGLARYVFDTDPATASTALGTIADTSREALDEMRRVLAVLRLPADDDAPEPEFDPQPGLDQIETLLERVRAAGVSAELVVTGVRRSLPPGPDLCAYRVVQESLTNVIKHALPASATVHLEYRPRELTVRITDDGDGAPAAAPGSPGHGLAGMRERARLYEGSLSAGVRAHGGFEVELRLPLTPLE